MIGLKSLTVSSPLYAEVEREWVAAFPRNERRSEVKQRRFLNEKEEMEAFVLVDDVDCWQGAVVIWHFRTFVYIEHLFVLPDRKGRGLGTAALRLLSERYGLPIVLEAELPTDEVSAGRIAFYRKNGFSVYPEPYLQPPYHEGDAPFPLLLLTDGGDAAPCFTDAVTLIHHQVYEV